MKKDNKGFSLIELMAAVVILAIIVTPLLHSFMTVVRTNAKARRLLRSTTVAENVMEGLSGLSIETIAQQFHLRDGSELVTPTSGITNPYNANDFIFLNMSGDGFDYGEIVPAGNLVGVTPDTAYSSSVTSSVSGINAISHQFQERNLSKTDPQNQKYYYYLKNVEEDRQKFDVRITLDASEYRTTEERADDGTVTIKGQEHAYNEDLLVNVDRMDQTKDFMWIEPAEAKMLFSRSVCDILMEEYFSEDSQAMRVNKKYTDSDGKTYWGTTTNSLIDDEHINWGKEKGRSFFEDFVEKNIEVTYDIRIGIDKGKYTVSFRVYSSCKCPFVGKGCKLDRHKTEGCGTGEIDGSSQDGIQTLKSFATDDLRNVYLFYYPTYNSSGNIFDYISIFDLRSYYETNPKPVNIYIIKQLNGNPTYTEEKNYKMSLNYMEDSLMVLYDPTESINDYACTNIIHSNLCTIKKADGTTEYENQIQYEFAMPDWADFMDPISVDQNDAKKFFGFDKNDPDPNNPNPDTWVPTLTGETTNVNDYIYLKTVEIYPAGTFDDINMDSFDFEERYDGDGKATSDEAKLAGKRINILTSRQ